jgi:uncharacterized membrane protein
MPELFAPLLFLHVLGAIVALGPGFAFPLIGAMGGREPQHANFATRLTHRLGDRLVEPFILSTALTGAGLIWARSIPVLSPAYRWLLLSIVIYAVALAFSWFVQRPSTLRVIELSGGFPRPGAEPAPDVARPAGGPSPELVAAISRSRRNGMVLTLLGLALVLLMVVKPALGF